MEEECFVKKDWVLMFKKLARDYSTEYTSRFNPLVLFKKDFTSFIDDSNREATKADEKFAKLQRSKFKEIADIKGKSSSLLFIFTLAS
jgi:hypothetical protein